MTVTSISTPLEQVAPSRSDALVEEAIISASEIRHILYLAVRGGVDKLPEAEDHAVDTYA